MKKSLMENVTPIAWNERIHFECHHCGACCRHVKDSIPLESLDVYRIARFLRSQDKSFDSIDYMLSRYAEPVPLHECGYFIYTLKTVGADDACIFLKDNRCTIQAAKPRACRTYPLVAEPDDSSSFQYYLSMEKSHHFTGRKFKARDWMNQYFTQEDEHLSMQTFRQCQRLRGCSGRYQRHTSTGHCSSFCYINTQTLIWISRFRNNTSEIIEN